jgi:RimJ/RimL family protein N-acetyltransferase
MIDFNYSLKTKRLIIRAYKESDFEAWKKSCTVVKKAQNKWDRGPVHKSALTKAIFKKLLAQHKKHRKQDIYYNFIAFDRRTGDIVGHSALMDITRNVFQNATMGYGVLNLYWGQGFGKEIVKATMEIAFSELSLHRVEAGIDPRNRKSIALSKSCGLRREGLSKKRIFLGGEWKDMAIFAMTADEMGFEVKPSGPKGTLR